MEKDAVVIKKSRMTDWVDALRRNYLVCGPVKYKFEVNFKEIEPGMEMALDYTRTVIPPKKYLHPIREAIGSYDRSNGQEWKLPEITKKTVVFGVHPCDARAMQTYDVIFGGDTPDPYYWNRRKNTIVIATGCMHPDEDCFCLSWNECGPTMDKGFDLLMTDIGDKYLVEIGSLEGSLLVQHDFFEKAAPEDREAKRVASETVKGKIRKHVPDGAHLPEFLEKNYDDKAWDVETAKCVSCGTCTIVCPTCFCYHVEDFNKWNLKDGERVRVWDSCQLIDFAEVAMGENFRKDRGARLKWRIYHKLAYWPEQFGTLGCVGCGRCMKYCIADIDMTEAISAIKGEKVNA